MARKFGTSNTNRVGTGKIEPQESGADKWAGSVAAQVATAANVKGILTKTVPVAYVICDPENPRKLAVTQEQITKIATGYSFDKNQLQVDDPSDWIEDYVSKVGEAEKLTGKALGDLESLVGFAASLKSADRLLHPIVVWRDESTFHLIAGERRLLAHILLGESNIAARIVELGYSRAEIDTLQWEENVHRVDMSLWERVDHIKKLLEAGEGVKKTSVTKLSKIIGKSRAESQRYLAVLRFPTKALLNAISAGKVSDLKSAAALAQLAPSELEAKLNGSTEKTTAPKPSIKFTNKDKAPQFGQLIKAAAKQLKMDALIKEADLDSSSGINDAIALLVAELEERSHG
jgi:ParB/RepB/Spo0J family partition protein